MALLHPAAAQRQQQRKLQCLRGFRYRRSVWRLRDCDELVSTPKFSPTSYLKSRGAVNPLCPANLHFTGDSKLSFSRPEQSGGERRACLSVSPRFRPPGTATCALPTKRLRTRGAKPRRPPPQAPDPRADRLGSPPVTGESKQDRKRYVTYRK